MGLFGITTQGDRIEALARDTNQQIHLVAKLTSSMNVAILEMENCVRDLDHTVRGFSQKLGDIMSNQDRANEIAEGIAEDTETIARVADAFIVAVSNANAEIERLRSQLDAEQADNVDLSGVEAAAADLSGLADVLATVLNPDEPSPTPDDVAVPEPVEPEPAADVVAGDTSEAPAEPVAEEPATEEPAAPSEVSDAAPEEPVVPADETVTPVEETAAPADETAAEEAPATGDVAATDEEGRA